MKKTILAIFVVASFVLMTGFVMAAWPNGASSVTEGSAGSQSYKGGVSAANHTAIAGNVTELNIDGSTTTQTWSGYYGNVSGGITLANAAGDEMYNWSTANPSGEIFAATVDNVDWNNIACATVPNMTALETSFNIDVTDSDGVNETFATTDHTMFYAASKTITGCPTAKILNNAGVGVFEEALLHDGTNAVFASIITQDTIGFNGNSYDFQMMVLEDGHNANTQTTPYHFYVELE